MGKPLTTGMLAGLPVTRVTEKPATFNALIYGNSGMGKTVLCGSASAVPDMSPVLFIDIEDGTNSLRTTYPDCDVVVVDSWEGIVNVLRELENNPDLYKTIVVDSLSEMQKLALYYIMSKANPPMDPTVDKAGWDEYAKILEVMRMFTRRAKKLPCNVLMTALLDEEKDKKTGKTMYKPLLTGKFKQEIGALPDEVFYLYVVEQYNEEIEQDQMVRVLLTAATDTAVAKDRSGMLPQVIPNPTMEIVYNTMFNK